MSEALEPLIIAVIIVHGLIGYQLDWAPNSYTTQIGRRYLLISFYATLTLIPVMLTPILIQ